MPRAQQEGYTLAEIVGTLGGVLHGDGNVLIRQVANLMHAGEGQISFLSNPKYRSHLKSSKASALIVGEAFVAECPAPCIVHPNPYLMFARVSTLLNPHVKQDEGIHPSAVVLSSLPSSVSVGATASIGKNVVIGDGCWIGPGVRIANDVVIGANCLIYPNVVIYQDCQLGQRVIVHGSSVIGSDGFGYARNGQTWIKIPQIGRVIIGDDVEIGSGTTIDRGAIDDTVIGDGVKIDNQVHIAHNVQIGPDCAIAGCVGIAGSTRLGARCTVGGQAGIIGHLELGDDVHISAGTLVTKSLRRSGQYTSGTPIELHSEWLKNAAHLRRLDRLEKRLKRLESERGAQRSLGTDPSPEES